jgi:hypothetical protein
MEAALSERAGRRRALWSPDTAAPMLIWRRPQGDLSAGKAALEDVDEPCAHEPMRLCRS